MDRELLLETDRIILRRYRQADLQDSYEYLSAWEVVKYEPYKVMNLTEVEAELAERIASDEMIALELKANHKLIGNVYFWKYPQGNPIWKDTFVYSLLHK